MAKNTAQTKIDCPRCGINAEMKIDLDLRVSSNVTVIECPDEICEHRFAKDQSVKLSGSLVLEVAEAMESMGGYSSLGEFVREAVRARAQHIRQQDNMEAYGAVLTAIAQDPETWKELMSDTAEVFFEEEDQ